MSPEGLIHVWFIYVKWLDLLSHLNFIFYGVMKCLYILRHMNFIFFEVISKSQLAESSKLDIFLQLLRLG